MDEDFFQLLEKISQISDVTVNVIFIKNIDQSYSYNSSIDVLNNSDSES